MIAFGALSAYARAGKDESGLGRAVWLLIEYNGHKFRLTTAYRPCGNRTKEEGKRGYRYTVWHQHYRYYHSKGIQEPDVHELFDDYLFSKIAKWRSDGEEFYWQSTQTRQFTAGSLPSVSQILTSV